MADHVTCLCPVTGKRLVWLRIWESEIADVGDGSMLGSREDSWELYSPRLTARYHEVGEEPLKEWLRSLKLAEVLGYTHVQLEHVTCDSIVVVGLDF